jgi:adenylate kinase
MESNNLNYRAILIVGPTGSGKSPLGDLLQARGLGGKRCFHFDFGANLREVAEASFPREPLTDDDVETIRSVLGSGALLEDDQFHIAKKILLGFISKKGVGEDSIIILNGLPRHIGQAGMIDSIIKIERVICLECSPEVVAERIRINTGGDRTHRTDDSLDEIRNKLDIFRERTAPLVGHYRSKGSEISLIDIDIIMRAEDMWAILH